MVKNTYGKTAWGKAFLDAIGKIDQNARLGRGKTYANTGKVQHMLIEDPCKVTATVQGTDEYSVVIDFVPLDEAEKKKTFSIIQSDAMILGKILYGELPDELLGLLRENHIELFPISWNDMKAICSCPDFANPCKHMAACYFHLTTHIDQDPFVLFRLRGLTLLSHFGIDVQDVDPGYPLPKNKWTDDQGVQSGTANKECELLKIPPMSNFILDCLKPNPPYCLSLDYKDIMAEFYSHAIKKTPEKLTHLTSQKDDDWSSEIDTDEMHQILSHSHIMFPITELGNIKENMIYIHNEVFDGEKKTQALDAFKSMPKCIGWPPEDRDRPHVKEVRVGIDVMTGLQLFLLMNNDFGSPSYRWFYYAFRVATSIINAQAYIPTVLPLKVSQSSGITSFRIIWKPLYTCGAISTQLEHLEKVFPEDGGVVNLKEKNLAATPSCLHLISSVTTSFVKDLEFMHKKCKVSPPKESEAIFRGIPYNIGNINEDKVARSLVKEYSVFDLMKLDLKIDICIEPYDAKGIHSAEEVAAEAEYCLCLRLQEKNVDGRGEFLKEFLGKCEDKKAKVLKLIAILHPYLTPMSKLLNVDFVPLSHIQLEQFVVDTAKIFSNIGVTVVMPKELRTLLKPEATLYATSKLDLDQFPDKYKTFLSLADLLQFDWMVCLGNEMISFSDFEKMVQGGKKLIKYKDQYVAISSELRKLLLGARKKPTKLSNFEILKEALNEKSIFRFSNSVDTFLKSLTRKTDHEVILADDMGLGKTIQTIAVILQMKNERRLKKPALIIVPTCVLINWEREIAKFGPSLSVRRYYGVGRSLADLPKNTALSTQMKPVQPSTSSPSQANSPKLRVSSSLFSPSTSNKFHKSPRGNKCLDKALRKCKSAPKVNNLSSCDDQTLSPVKFKPKVKFDIQQIEDQEREQGKLVMDEEELPDLDCSDSSVSTSPKCASSTDTIGSASGEDREFNELQDVTNAVTKVKKRKCASPRVSVNSKRQKLNETDIILTTYQLAWRDIDTLSKTSFDMLVIDEAQKIKNAKSQTAKAIKKIKTAMRIALSGTPVENKLLELWSLFDFTLPKYLGSPKEFGESFAKPIELHRDPEKAKALKEITAPFMLRRLKTDKDIIQDLPDKIIDNMYCTLTPIQVALYESKVQTMEEQLGNLADKKNRSTFIFEMMLRLKQICNHPANYVHDRKRDAESSGKLKNLIDLLYPILLQGEKVLIFTQFVDMIHIMAEVIEEKLHIKPLVYHGKMGEQKKDLAVTKFISEPHSQIFIVSTKAGGVGLNLTAANHVVHYDLWYNPAVENQATDRAFRIGQEKRVFVYRFITENTFEEKIDQMIQQKKDLAEFTVTTKEEWIGNLDDEQIKDLFTRKKEET